MKGRDRLLVNVICSRDEVKHSGEWLRQAGPADVLADLRQQAIRYDMPIQVEIFGHGIWSITPDGRVMKLALFR